MLFSRNKIQIDVYINYGNDNIRHKKLVAEPEISALDALGVAAEIEYTPNESATNHHGAMVTAIDGFKVGINHFWIYYIFEKNQAGWRTAYVHSRLIEDYRGHQGGMAISYCD
jgi:hypothetical protein